MVNGGAWQIDEGSYDRLLSLPHSGWAWEFKRRDLKLRTSAHCSLGIQPIFLRRRDGSVLIRQPNRCRVAESYGLHFIPDPRKSALETTPFWLPECMSSNMDAAAAIGERLGREGNALNWQSIPGKKSILIVPGRRTKLNISSEQYSAQLAIDESQTPIPLAIYIKLKIGARMIFRENLQCLQEFARHCRGIEFNCRPRRGFSPQKLKQALIALDGLQAGATQRQIGAAIFGEQRIQSDWDEGVHSYKSRTRRLIKKGRSLMEENYLNLL